MTPEIIKAVLALIGVLVGSIPTYIVMRRKNDAEIDKLKAETEKIKAEAEKIRNGPKGLIEHSYDDQGFHFLEDEIIIFEESQGTRFHQYFENLLDNAKKIVLIGTGLNVIQNDSIRNRIFEKAAKGECDIEIFLADPNSPAIENRLIEEELGKKKPPVAYSGLMSRLDSLLSDWNKLGCPERIKLNLFSNYPTFALLIIDEKYFFYPYAFATLGNFSPVFQINKFSKKAAKLIHFIDEHYELQKKFSVELKNVFAYRQKRKKDTSGLQQFAVYFVPSKETDIYKIGSEILGYDIRNQNEIPTKWKQYVGESIFFGFHLTICDALYFLTKSEIYYCIEEVKFLAKRFHPFTITDLQVKESFPNTRSISIVANDISGNLEALHHELVQRIYKRATGSNYTFNTAKLDRDSDYQRANLMTKLYNAPYILKNFHPHFTLLTNINESFANFSNDFHAILSNRIEKSIELEKLAIMTREYGCDYWQIQEEIPLVK